MLWCSPIVHYIFIAYTTLLRSHKWLTIFVLSKSDTTDSKQFHLRLKREEARRTSAHKRDADLRESRWYVNKSEHIIDVWSLPTERTVNK